MFGITGQVRTQSGEARSRQNTAVNTNSQHISRQPQALLGMEAGLFIVPRQQNAMQKGHVSCLRHRRAGSEPVTGANGAFMIASGHCCRPAVTWLGSVQERFISSSEECENRSKSEEKFAM